jgi:hypothetical protein
MICLGWTFAAAAMAAPDDQLASAQGLLGATLELVAGVAALTAGVLYDNWGAPAVSGGSAVVIALGGSARRTPRRRGLPRLAGKHTRRQA